MPACQTIMSAQYESLKEKVSKLIRHNEALSLTTDMWTSLQMESYMTVTAHFIDGDWKAQNLVLETKQIEEARTGRNIGARLSEVAKRVSVVCDNEANMALCVETLKESHEWSEMQGVRCARHTLQLCINTALKQEPICHTVAEARHQNRSRSSKMSLSMNLLRMCLYIGSQHFQCWSDCWSNTGPLLQCRLTQTLPRVTEQTHMATELHSC